MTEEEEESRGRHVQEWPSDLVVPEAQRSPGRPPPGRHGAAQASGGAPSVQAVRLDRRREELVSRVRLAPHQGFDRSLCVSKFDFLPPFGPPIRESVGVCRSGEMGDSKGVSFWMIRAFTGRSSSWNCSGSWDLIVVVNGCSLASFSMNVIVRILCISFPLSTEKWLIR